MALLAIMVAAACAGCSDKQGPLSPAWQSELDSARSSIAGNRFDEADVSLKKALEHAGSAEARVKILSDGGDAYFAAAKATATGDAYSRALRIYQQAGNEVVGVNEPLDAAMRVRFLEAQGDCCVGLNDNERAERYYKDAADKAPRGGEGGPLLGLGRVLFAEKKYAQAENVLAEAAAALKREKRTEDAIEALRLLARVYRVQRKWRQADNIYNEAIDLCEKIGIDTPLARAVRADWSSCLEEMNVPSWGQHLIDKLETKEIRKNLH